MFQNNLGLKNQSSKFEKCHTGVRGAEKCQKGVTYYLNEPLQLKVEKDKKVEYRLLQPQVEKDQRKVDKKKAQKDEHDIGKNSSD
jgi:hypothetical protein